jgi:hypothetical protein
MGKATIVGGGDKGNYTIKMDYGTATRDATVAAIAQHLTELATKITEAQTKLDAAKAAEAEKKTAAQKATNDYIAATQAIPKAFEDVSSAMDAVENLAASATATPEERKAAQDALTAAEAAYTAAQDAAKEALSEQTKAATALVEAKKKTAPLQLALDALVDEQTKLQKDKAYWDGLQLESTLQAWCADYTENGSGEVATMEIPGENQIVLIKPGAPAGNTVDGKLVAREVQSPEQVFFNAAILPGWQKFKPTYRSGVITALNTSNNTASVTLDAAQSSAAGLDINKMTALANVPVVYMTCHASAFAVGDACVVRFNGMDWAQPQVVGFVDNPKPCLPEVIVQMYITPNSDGVDQGFVIGSTMFVSASFNDTYQVWQLVGPNQPEYYYRDKIVTKRELRTYFWGIRNSGFDSAANGQSTVQEYTVDVGPALVQTYDNLFTFGGGEGSRERIVYDYATAMVTTATWTVELFSAMLYNTNVSPPVQWGVGNVYLKDAVVSGEQSQPLDTFTGGVRPPVIVTHKGKQYIYVFDRFDEKHPGRTDYLVYKYKPA